MSAKKQSASEKQLQNLWERMAQLENNYAHLVVDLTLEEEKKSRKGDLDLYLFIFFLAIGIYIGRQYQKVLSE